METSGCFLCHRPATLTCPSSDLKFCGPEHQVLCFLLLLLSFFICLSSDLKFCRSEHQILCMLTSLQCMCDILGFVRSVAHQRGPNLSLSKCQIVTLGGEDPLRLILKGKGLRLTWYFSDLFVVQSGGKCIDIIISATLTSLSSSPPTLRRRVCVSSSTASICLPPRPE